MEVNEIAEFLRNKKGYLKEGGKRLRKVLIKKGFEVTVNQCREAIRQVNDELKFNPYSSDDNKEAKILFFDIEVSYGVARAWRPGWKVNLSYNDFITHPKIICISYKWNHEDFVSTVRWDSNQDDKQLLEQFIPELNKADFVVAHNGDNFDLPWIKTRALYHNLDILPRYASVDTLKIARYKHRFPSNRLDAIGDYLGCGRKIKTEFNLWTRVIEDKCLNALEEMTAYCEQDVLLLEEVYNKLSHYELPATHVGVSNGEVKSTSPYISGSANIELVKTITTKAGTIKRLMKCLDTNKYFEMSNQNYKKFLEINN